MTFNTTSNDWYQSSKLQHRRKYSSVVTLASGPYVLGGEFSEKTSEVLRDGNWTDGPNLPFYVVISKAIELNTSSFVIIGGNWDKDQVWAYNEDTEGWSRWPNLPG